MANNFNIKIEGISAGTDNLVITAQADGYKENSANVAITVEDRPITTLTLDSESGSCTWGESVSVIANTNASAISVTDNNSDVATSSVDGFNITFNALKSGTATFTITSQAEDAEAVSVTYTLTVNQKEVTITVDEESKSLYVGSAGTISLETNGSAYEAVSSDNEVISITESGALAEGKATISFSALKEGSASITITATGDDMITATKVVSINSLALGATDLSLDKNSLELYAGFSGTVNATTSAETISVTDNNSDIATSSVEGKVITINALAVGTATFTVSAQAEGKVVTTAEISVVITEQPTTELSSDTQSIEKLYVGDSQVITITTNAESINVVAEKGGIVTFEVSKVEI